MKPLTRREGPRWLSLRSPGVAMCEHGYEAALCRDAMSEQLARDVDFAHEHAYEWASQYVGGIDFPDYDAAEDFAAFIARCTARYEGLDGLSLPREVERWREQT